MLFKGSERDSERLYPFSGIVTPGKRQRQPRTCSRLGNRYLSSSARPRMRSRGNPQSDADHESSSQRQPPEHPQRSHPANFSKCPTWLSYLEGRTVGSSYLRCARVKIRPLAAAPKSPKSAAPKIRISAARSPYIYILIKIITSCYEEKYWAAFSRGSKVGHFLSYLAI